MDRQGGEDEEEEAAEEGVGVMGTMKKDQPQERITDEFDSTVGWSLIGTNLPSRLLQKKTKKKKCTKAFSNHQINPSFFF